MGARRRPAAAAGGHDLGMRVVEATRFGGPDVLITAEAPDPVAGPGNAVVDVALPTGEL